MGDGLSEFKLKVHLHNLIAGKILTKNRWPPHQSPWISRPANIFAESTGDIWMIH